MSPADMIADLRSRINPSYAHQLGTASYERRVCAEALEALLEEREELLETATKAEREACAKTCERVIIEHGNWKAFGHECAKAIRLRYQARVELTERTPSEGED